MNRERNFSIHISPEQKEVLRGLSKRSNMTMAQYIEATVGEALDNEVTYKMVPVRATKGMSGKGALVS